MNTQASKEELAKMILESEDSKLIEKVRKLLIKEKKDFYDEFTEDQKLEIQYGIEQLDRGESITWEDFKKEESSEMYNVILSELAGKKLDEVLDYLIEEWSEKSSEDFSKKFEEKLKHVGSFPESCIKSKKHFNLHLCVVTKQTSFLYRMINTRIEVITVFDNRISNKSIRKEIRKYYGHL